MQKPGLFAAFFGVVALTLLPSCQDEDFGFTTDEIRQEVYNRNFKEIFGEVDPDHNWSMAQNVKVNINVPGANGYRLRILTEAPTNRNSVLLYQGQMEGDELSANVDVLRGTTTVYVELWCELGVTLVDGYYSIDENSQVNIAKPMTRAEVATPTCADYTRTLTRWDREWQDNWAVPGDEQYSTSQWLEVPRWYGFLYNDYKINTDYLIPYGGGKIPAGWMIHSTSEPSDRTHANEQGGENQWGDGSRGITTSNAKYSFKSETKDASYALYFVSNDPNVAPYCEYGNHDEKWAKIPAGKAKVHVLLANWYKGASFEYKVSINRQWNDDPYEYTGTVSSNNNFEGDQYKDVNFQVCSSPEINFKGGNYKIHIELITAYNFNGDNGAEAVCGGFIVESWQSSDNKTTKSETITSGQIRYTDVRGGSVIKYDGTHNILCNHATWRNWANNKFMYRTFDVRKMVDENGASSNPNSGYINGFHIISGGTDGVAITIGTEKVKYIDMFPLYGMYKSIKTGEWTGSPFREGDNHIDPFFTDKGYHNAEQMEMKPDAQVVTIGPMNIGDVHYDGSVTAKMLGIGTGWGNDVGYFYYPKSKESELMVDATNGEKVLDFNKVPKIVIRQDMQSAISGQRPDTWDGDNLAEQGLWFTSYNAFVDACTAISLSESDWNGLKDHLSTYNNSNNNTVKPLVDEYRANGADQAKKQKVIDATFNAPIYKLAYFGYGDAFNANSGSYVWPKDMVIGFFGIRTDANVACELARVYTTSASVQRHYFNDLPRGSAFSYKGKNYIGLEDEWDYDNNDFLFELQGVHAIEPDITPDDDPVENSNTQDWMIACEDLGGTFDYDFNDLVWMVSKVVNTTEKGGQVVSGTTDLYFTAMAAGGTLPAYVEYNTSLALKPGDAGWSDENWMSLGEIHSLVKRDKTNKTLTDSPLNVDLKVPVTTDDIGERIHLGQTIPTSSSDITMENILTHFRVRVYYKDNTEDSETANNYLVQNIKDKTTNKKTPQMLLLPGKWSWPGECVPITEVYSLTNWVNNKGETGWYNSWRNSWKEQWNFIRNPFDK